MTLELRLQSPVGGEPLVFKWPLSSNVSIKIIYVVYVHIIIIINVQIIWNKYKLQMLLKQ